MSIKVKRPILFASHALYCDQGKAIMHVIMKLKKKKNL